MYPTIFLPNLEHGSFVSSSARNNLSLKRADAPGQLCCGMSVCEGPAPTEGPAPLCLLTRAHAREGRFGGGAEEEPWSPRSVLSPPAAQKQATLPGPGLAARRAAPGRSAAGPGRGGAVRGGAQGTYPARQDGGSPPQPCCSGSPSGTAPAGSPRHRPR